MTTSRTDAPDTSWADTGDDDGHAASRHSGMDRHDPESYDPAAVLAGLAPRGATAEMPAAQASFDGILERPEWAKSSPPEVVAEAWSALEAAVEAANDAERATKALVGEQASAERVEAARVRSAVAAGRPVKASAPGRDFPAERRHLSAVAAGHRERCSRLRTTYDELVEVQRPDWAARIVESMPSAKASALKALAEAGDRVARLLGDAGAAQALLIEPGGSLVALPVLPVRRFLEAMQALAQEIEASAPLGGDSLVHPRMDPPYRDREQISASIRAGVVDSRGHWLADLERREGYRLSSLTRGIPLGDKPSEDTAW